jgi:hypothetical protein
MLRTTVLHFVTLLYTLQDASLQQQLLPTSAQGQSSLSAALQQQQHG